MKKTNILLGLLLVSATALGLCACDWQSPHTEAVWMLRNCNACHAGQAQNSSYDHSGFTNDDCMDCHKDTSKVSIDHTEYTIDDCWKANCHTQDAAHKTYSNDSCVICHNIGEKEPTSLDTTKTPDHSDYTVDQCAICHNGNIANAYPTDHADYVDNCTNCHNIGEAVPVGTACPDHSGYDAESCAECHELPSDKTHTSGNYDTCEMCHNIGEVTPEPMN